MIFRSAFGFHAFCHFKNYICKDQNATDYRTNRHYFFMDQVAEHCTVERQQCCQNPYSFCTEIFKAGRKQCVW